MLSINLSKIVTMNHVILHKLLSHTKETAKTAATLVLILSSFILQAQNIDANRKTMNKIIMDTEHYHHATAVADSFDLAINDAVAMLASQIMTNVRSEASSVIKEHNLNGEITSSSYFSNVVKTFTDVRLTDYHVLMVGKPTKKTKTYTAFVYISSDRVAEIV